jgi:hypothetical protein
LTATRPVWKTIATTDRCALFQRTVFPRQITTATATPFPSPRIAIAKPAAAVINEPFSLGLPEIKPNVLVIQSAKTIFRDILAEARRIRVVGFAA